jgi:hypothetical protein
MNGPLSQLASFQGSVILRATFDGAGPGLAMRFEIGIRSLPGMTELWSWNEDDSEPFLDEVLSVRYTWPVGVRALAESGHGAESTIGEISVRGANLDVADVYRLAWGGDEQKALAMQLASCTRAQLAALRAQVGSLASVGAQRRLRGLVTAALEFEPTAEFGDHLDTATSNGDVVGQLRAALRRLHRSC